jgi:hypothetical protein
VLVPLRRRAAQSCLCRCPWQTCSPAPGPPMQMVSGLWQWLACCTAALKAVGRAGGLLLYLLLYFPWTAVDEGKLHACLACSTHAGYTTPALQGPRAASDCWDAVPTCLQARCPRSGFTLEASCPSCEPPETPRFVTGCTLWLLLLLPLLLIIATVASSVCMCMQTPVHLSLLCLSSMQRGAATQPHRLHPAGQSDWGGGTRRHHPAGERLVAAMG